jgi:hypothetical protein
MTQETAGSETTTPVPAQRSVEPGPPADPAPTGEPGESPGSVPFDRLLSVAALTPAQASHLAVQLLDASCRSDPDDPESSAVGRLGAVSLTRSGDLDVRRPAADAGTPVTELLDRLLRNARRLPAHPRPDQLSLLHSLEDAARAPLPDPGPRARALEQALAGTLGPSAHRRVAGQLGAVVEAFAHVAPGAPAGRPAAAGPGPVTVTTTPAVPTRVAPARSAADPQRAVPARHGPKRPARRPRALMKRRTRGRVAIVALVLAAALAISGYVVLRGPGVEFVGSLGGDSQPAAPDTTTPAQPAKQTTKQPKPKRAPAVSTLASRRAGPITGVALRKTGSCDPGALCPVRVTVRLRPASTARAVTWKVGAARVCKRGVTWSLPTTVTAQPGWSTVYADSSVRVPRGSSLALVALTSAPARAQSRPVPVAGSALRC